MMNLRGVAYRQLEGRLTQRLYLGSKTYFIKQHHGVGWKEIFKNIIQGRWPVLGAKNEWLAIQKLEQLGVSVPKIAAYGQKGLNPAQKKSFVLMEELAPIISLETLCGDWKHSPPSFRFKQKLIAEVARIARIMHENGINHRDFYLCHFLLDLSTASQAQHTENLRLFLIDLHRAQIRRLTPERWIIKDLGGLYFSSMDIGLTQRDILRFMQIYRAKPLRQIVVSEAENTFWQKVKVRGQQLYRDHT